MNLAPLQALIAAGESLVAFANTQGGTVLVGVSDGAKVQGVTVGKETLNEWLGQIKSATSPSLIPDLVAHPLNGKTVVAIQVAEFPVKPVSTRGRYYKRIASSNHCRFATKPLRHHVHIGRFKTLSMIFDDKITIFSPGTFYGGISVADIQADNYRSSLRNKLVAESFYLINAIEKYGSGFIRIRQALQDYPEIDFEIKEFAGGVMVTFAQKQPEAQPESPPEGVSEGVNALIMLISKQPGMRSPAMAEALQTSPQNIERWLKQLKDNQHIEFRGAPKTGGYYPKDL